VNEDIGSLLPEGASDNGTLAGYDMLRAVIADVRFQVKSKHLN
jgi:hypothetical protein